MHSEKAKELVEMFGIAFGDSFGYVKEDAKKCAMICVEEIIKSLPDVSTFDHGKIGFWIRVKKEIIKL